MAGQRGADNMRPISHDGSFSEAAFAENWFRYFFDAGADGSKFSGNK